MPSFQIAVSPHRRAAAKLVREVRNGLQALAVEAKAERAITQSEAARRIGVHRSVVHRELKGQASISISRVAELACAYGKEVVFEIKDPKPKSHNIITETRPLHSVASINLSGAKSSVSFSQKAS